VSTVVVLVGNPKPASRTRTVGEAIAARLAPGHATVTVDLAEHAAALFDLSSAAVDAAIEMVRSCRVLVVASPIYKASFPGLLKVFLDRLPHEALVGVSAVPAMVGIARDHALAVDHHLRPVLLALGASCPTSGVFLTESELPDLDQHVATWSARAHPLLAMALAEV
jgi:FMN reductase